MSTGSYWRNCGDLQRNRSNGNRRMTRIFNFVATIALLTAYVPAFAQTFSSTSTGTDGALNLTTPGTIVFTPSSFTPALDPDGDHIFNFTTINIAAGVTVQLSGSVLKGPVYWLAQGAVTINGTISLNGANGYNCVDPPNPALRTPSAPGAGGYAGGIGALGSDAYQPGAGPGGGTGGDSRTAISNGHFTGNRFLVPLIGGSGGTGGITVCGGGGGAGGGALLIASSTSITVNGSITANGGTGGSSTAFSLGGGSGSGGAIRLAAPSIDGGGSLSVTPTASPGLIRLEAFHQNFTGTTTQSAVGLAVPASVTLPSGGPPAITVVSVSGVPVSATPTGSFLIPDTTINQSTPAIVAIQAKNIPVGTAVTLYFSSENGPDLTVAASALAGTLANSTATASVTFPPGFSRGYVKASWTQ